jgi:hypothetical protein
MEFPITACRADDSYGAALEAGLACRRDSRGRWLMGVGALAISIITTNTARPADAARLLG